MTLYLWNFSAVIVYPLDLSKTLTHSLILLFILSHTPWTCESMFLHCVYPTSLFWAPLIDLLYLLFYLYIYIYVCKSYLIVEFFLHVFFSFSRFFTVSCFLPLYSKQYSISDWPREPAPITYVLFSMIFFFSFPLDIRDFFHNHLLLFAFVMMFPKHLPQLKMLTSFTNHSDPYRVFSIL